MSDEVWTNEEFDRITKRLRTYKLNKESLSSDEQQMCAEFFAEVDKDSTRIEEMIALSANLLETSNENRHRAAVVEWLARTP